MAWLFAGLVLAYWLSLWGPDYPGDWLLKAAPMLLAAIVLLASVKLRYGLPMAIGFVAAGAGDAFLALDRHDFLMQALLCFLVTQVAYLAAFLAWGKRLTGRWKLWLPAVIYGLAAYIWMLPELNDFMVPVLIYVTALVAMVVYATCVERRPGPLWVGAMLFLVADSLIGIERFIAALSVPEVVIVAIYSSGQLLIFIGALRAMPLREGMPLDPRSKPL